MLYKYRSDSIRTQEIITCRKVWLAKPSTLNDPLECQIKLITPTMISEHIRRVKSDQASGFIMGAIMARKNQSTFYGLNSKQTKHLLNRIKFAKGFDKKYRIISDFHRSIGSTGFSAPDGYIKSLSTQLSELGVFSLSEDPANILMWSHYGESHRGIALGFNPVEGSDLENPNMCRRVIYSSELSEFSFTDGFSASMTYYADRKPEPEISFRDTQVQRAIFTKTTDWEYEKEWRYIRSTEGAYDLPAPIAEVIFGAKCPAETREKYREIVLSTLGDGIKFREAFFRPGSAFLELKDC